MAALIKQTSDCRMKAMLLGLMLLSPLIASAQACSDRDFLFSLYPEIYDSLAQHKFIVESCLKPTVYSLIVHKVDSLDIIGIYEFNLINQDTNNLPHYICKYRCNYYAVFDNANRLVDRISIKKELERILPFDYSLVFPDPRTKAKWAKIKFQVFSLDDSHHYVAYIKAGKVLSVEWRR